MDKFDEKVIGYESTKEILRQILDILKRPEVYKRKGISIPRGLLMESDPGLGKSLLASILMEESERKPFVFRKTSQENSFLDELRAVFAMAKEDAPSILLLEDLNLYVESNSPYIQASADIEQADKLMDIWLCHFAGGGFVGIESGDNRMSEQRLSYNEAIKSAKLEELYRRAYKILHDNRDFLLAVQKELLEHETLLISDLAKIRESCI